MTQDQDDIITMFEITGGKHMSDDLHKRGKPDQDRINVNEEWERKHWAKELDISEARLREMVKAHGPMVKDVKKALAK